MTAGFGAVPDELRETAGRIVDVVGGAAGMAWQGPSGDYGHAGVQAGWAQFVEDVKGQVENLLEKAHGHGDDLKSAAVQYLESEQSAGSALSGLGELVDSLGSSTGGAVGGVISGVLSGGDAAGTDAPGGFINPSVSARLFPGASEGTQTGGIGGTGTGAEGPLY